MTDEPTGFGVALAAALTSPPKPPKKPRRSAHIPSEAMKRKEREAAKAAAPAPRPAPTTPPIAVLIDPYVKKIMLAYSNDELTPKALNWYSHTPSYNKIAGIGDCVSSASRTRRRYGNHRVERPPRFRLPDYVRADGAVFEQIIAGRAYIDPAHHDARGNRIVTPLADVVAFLEAHLTWL